MNLGHCTREREVIDLLRSGSWPAACEPELHEHVAGCSQCAQTVMLKSAFAVELATAKDEARLQSAGVLWWRAQLRRRNEVVERVNRPIARAQRFALLINLLATVALLASQWRHGYRLAEWFSTFHPSALWTMAAEQPGVNLMLLIVCVAAVVALGGITVYLASDR